MPVYLYLNLFTIFFPLVLSFDKRVHFWRKWYAVWPGVLLTAAVFIPWDARFTEMGVWGFNPDYLIGLQFFGLPLEEVLFFITVPYACLFIYECLNVYWPDTWLPKYIPAITITAGALLTAVGLMNLDKWYTAVSCLGAAVMLGLHWWRFGQEHLARFYRAYLVHLLPFLTVNGILTYLPVVWYNDAENLGIRLISIPIEDTSYSLLLFLLTVTGYEMVRAWAKQNKTTRARVKESITTAS